VDELHDGGQRDVLFGARVGGLGGQQHERGTEQLALEAQQVRVDVTNARHVARHDARDGAVHGIQFLAYRRLETGKRWRSDPR